MLSRFVWVGGRPNFQRRWRRDKREAGKRTIMKSCSVGHCCWRRPSRRIWCCCFIIWYVHIRLRKSVLTTQGPRYHGNFQEAAGRFLTCKLDRPFPFYLKLTRRRRSYFDQYLPLHPRSERHRQATLYTSKHLSNRQSNPYRPSDSGRTYPTVPLCFRHPIIARKYSQCSGTSPVARKTTPTWSC